MFKFSGLHSYWVKVFLCLSIFDSRAGQKILLTAIVLALAAVSMSTRAAVVLQYHHVSESTPASTSVTPALFKQHMDYLAEHEFKIVPLPELVKQLKAGKALPDKTVAITFDDAYESVYSEAYPLLKKRGWPFTVFINTDPHDQNKKSFATWAQIQEMAKQGVTIANHTTKHGHLLRLRDNESRAQWRKRITQEILDAEQRITEKTGQKHRLLAYPYGEYDNHVKDALKELDFVAFGQQSGPLFALDDLLALPRFPFGGSYGDLQDFATKVNTRPFAIASVELYEDAALKKPLDDLVLSHGKKPVLALALEDQKLLSRVNCFASGQGAIKTEVRDGK
ncbi:MAG TPA: polysaccharide deacetylase family protein, partial [Cellvibrio sp.]|nr:polysaccharide deacetylase family protein [Cellvibrio sp.]